jgi:hypothetical protein
MQAVEVAHENLREAAWLLLVLVFFLKIGAVRAVFGCE